MISGRLAARSVCIVRWLLPATLLHVALVLGAALSPRARSRQAPAADQPRSVEREASLELTLLDDVSRAPAAAPSRGAAFDRTLSTNGAPRAQLPPAAAGGEPAQPRGARPELAGGATPFLPVAKETPVSAAHEPPPPAAPSLSLAQLGIGANPFLAGGIEPVTSAEQANARLQAALHPSSVEREHRRGLGPAGPVADTARRLVLADEALLETSAVLNVRVDGEGHVTEVQMLEASSQIRSWEWIAARLARALQPVTLRDARSKQGWSMKLRLAASVELPSGAAPGLRMGVLGQQLAGSGGPGSTSLELSPTAKLDLPEPIDSIGRHLDRPIQFEVMLLKIRGDVADLGGTPRRVVEVAVLSIDPPATPH